MSKPTGKLGWQVEMRAASPEKLEIAIHDVIGGGFFHDGITSKDILGALRSAPKAKEIVLRVNSLGGIVDEAKGIGNLLAERATEGVAVTGIVDGLAASSGSFLLTFCQRVVMPSNTFQMLHQARGRARGTAEEIQGAADLMRRVNEQMAEAYAAAARRRGKEKTKEDFLAMFAQGDTYLDADEAIEMGLADEKLEPLKVAACLVDVERLPEGAPEAIRSAPYVGAASVRLTGSASPEDIAKAVAKELAKSRQLELPAVAQATPPAPGGQADSTKNPTGVEVQMQNAMKLLALKEDADEEAVMAAIKKLQASARAGDEIEKLVGASGDAAVGAVRALKASQEQHAELSAEVAKVKIQLARGNFETALKAGNDDRKISPAQQKHYLDRFEAAIKNGEDGSSVAEDLVGFLAATPKNAAVGVSFQRTVGGPETTGADGELKWNGKAYGDLTFTQRAQLAKDQPELWRQMKADHEAQS